MDPTEVLKHWQQHGKYEVTRALEVLYKVFETTKEESQRLYDALERFQIELRNARQDQQIPQWFDYSVTLKKRFRLNL